MNFNALQEFMDHLTQWRIPGNSVSVAIEGKEVFTYSSGFADLENKIPMTKDHFVNMYSCSKIATVVAALQLYERGLFLLDDPLYEFIPEYREMVIKDKDGLRKAEKPITLRHLFTMTSGLTYNRQTAAFQKARELTNGNMDTLTVVKCLAEDPISFEPGNSWQYSLSHDVLAAVVEVISGQRFRDYVKDHIFAALGMEDATFDAATVLDRMAVLYRFVDGSAQNNIAQQSGKSAGGDGYVRREGSNIGTFMMGPGYDSGGSGITATVGDYSKFCAALGNGGVGATGEKILSAGTIDLLRTNQLNPQQQKAFNWSQLKGYGYGLGVRTLVDKALSGTTGNVGEFGWGGAAGASVWVDPALKMSVCYAHHMLNPQETYYQPRVRNVIYKCLL